MASWQKTTIIEEQIKQCHDPWRCANDSTGIALRRSRQSDWPRNTLPPEPTIDILEDIVNKENNFQAAAEKLKFLLIMMSEGFTLPPSDIPPGYRAVLRLTNKRLY
ncbi:hypothetical protein CEXT_432691 [Caerostris extrusa]|uniref:Uncharacterized protein n=1 Tax=Caerostris extrusa TaxID=172846 RepID=A0AAV4NJB9_CAEEX|nr:hypothetical protein CEXT_432691 [Caerostris extrusa]